ncbi:hypothetical protein M0Q28_06385 [Patescibacteria group bacterium]|nr:hypothetical protein [Patescibacteria group bacterium]
MTPRRRLAAVPQAFNAMQLQGMYASSTAFGASSLFTVNQTSNTSATGTRTALEVRSAGTNDSNDFLIRGVNDLANTVFSVNRQGSVTTTGGLNVFGTASTTNLFVAGQLVCLANGTNCTGGSTDTLASVSARGSFATSTLQLYGGFVAGSSTVTSTLTVLGGVSTTHATATSLYIQSGTSQQAITVEDPATTFKIFTVSGEASLGTTNSSNLNFTTDGSSRWFIDTVGNLQPTSDASYNLGSAVGGRIFTGTFLNVTSINVTTTFVYASGFVTTTQLFANGGTFGSLTVGGSTVCLTNGTDCPAYLLAETDTLASVTARGGFSTTTLQLYGGFVGSSSTVTSTLTVLGSTSLQNVTGLNATFTNATATNLFVSGTVSTTQVYVTGQLVCLANGVNCTTPPSTDLNWTFDGPSDFVRNATPTTDLVLGSTATSTGAPAYFDLSGGTNGSSNFYFGHATNANVLIGGTSTTDTGLNALFALNGDDLFVHGNIGSASSIYTNGAFVAGSSSTYFGNGYIRKNDTGALAINTVSGTSFTNGVSQLWNSQVNPQKLSEFLISKTGEFLVRGRYVYVVNNSDNVLRILDATDPMNVRLVGQTADLGGTPTALADDGRFIYVGLGTADLALIDVSNPSAPFVVNTYLNIPGNSFKIIGKHLYAVGGSGIKIFDITNAATSIPLVGSDTSFESSDFVIDGQYLYSVGGSLSFQFAVVDISSPSNPHVVGTRELSSGSVSIALRGKTAFVADSSAGEFYAFDVKNPTNPFVMTTTTGLTAPGRVSVGGRYLYVPDGSAIQVYDVQTTTSIAQVGSIGDFGTASYFLPSGRYSFASDSAGGGAGFIAIYDTQGTEVQSLTAHSLEAGDGRILNDFVVGQALTVGSGLNVGFEGIGSWGALSVYATNTTSSFAGGVEIFGGLRTVGHLSAAGTFAVDGTLSVNGQIDTDLIPAANATYSLGSEFGNQWNAFFEHVTASSLYIQNRVNITGSVLGSPQLSVVTTTGVLGGGSPDIVVKDKTIFMTNSASNTLVVLDHSNFNSIKVVTTTQIGTGPFEMELAYPNSLMIARSGALDLYNVENAASPTLITTITATGIVDFKMVNGYVHYTSLGGIADYVVTDISGRTVGTLNGLGDFTQMDIQGETAYVADTASGVVRIIDITNPAAPTQIATYTPSSGAPSSVNVQGNLMFVGRTSVTTGDIVSIASSTSPTFLNTFSCSQFNCDVVFVAGRYVYTKGVNFVSNPAGVRVLDVNDPNNQVSYTAAEFGMRAFDMDINGRYLYVAGSFDFAGSGTTTLTVLDTGGLDAPGISAGAFDTGWANVRNSLTVGKDVEIVGSLSAKGGRFISDVDILSFSASPTLKVANSGPGAGGRNWGIWANTLSVGDTTGNQVPTGTQNYQMVISYNGGASGYGLCIDDRTNAGTCPDSAAANSSILADNAVTANAFDLAEMYSVSGSSTPGDLLVLDQTVSTTVKVSSGITYDSKVIGVVSTRPGFVLGWNGGAQVALAGRVPLKVAMTNGSIQIGDALVSSDIPGYAMKATKPGTMVGYALEDANATGTIEVFVNVGYYAGTVLDTDGTVTRISDDVVFASRETASSTNPFVDSWGLTFRGSVWDSLSSSVVSRDFSILNDVISSTSSLLTIRNSNGTSIFTMDEAGNASFSGDVQVGGRLFPSSRGLKQDDYYIFLDNQAPTGTYIATNADGWQSMDTYDFAERFYSPDALEPGDLVVVKNTGNHHVQRAWNETDLLVGIVSTRPAFIAGRPATNTHPIALSGRVPTKVSALKGEIKAGDPLAPSTMPGVAVKATKTGPIVGLALEDYSAETIGLIEVNVNPGWWTATEAPVESQTIIQQVSTDGASRRGMAKIDAGVKKVTVTYETINSYPFVQVTPRGLIVGAWGTENYSDTGFDIVLAEAQSFDAYFSWEVEPLQTGDRLYQSDGTFLDLNEMTGQPLGAPLATTTEEVIEPVEAPTTTTEVVETVTSTEPVVEEPVIVPEPVSEEPPSTESSTTTES